MIKCLLGVKTPFGYCGLISRYLDQQKQRFSGMKSHDCHLMMTQIFPVAIRGIMDKHVRETIFGFCKKFDVISRKSITWKQLSRLQEEIVVILCELEIYFPPAFFDICVHLLVHIVDDIIHLGPAFLHNMMPFERMNGVIKGFVRNRALPEGSIVQGYLTEECISFCTNLLGEVDDPVGLPRNRHLGRLNGVGHKNGRKELHVDFEKRRVDFNRANLVALQHLEMVDPWCKEHENIIRKKYIDQGRERTDGEVIREHNSTFLRWFKERLIADPPMDCPEGRLLYALAHGPSPNVATFQAYDINGFTFYTEEKDESSVYQNSGVTMVSSIGNEKLRYYGRIEEILELDYSGEKVSIFRVRWARRSTVMKENKYFATMVIPEAGSTSSSVNVTAQNEPWVLAKHVSQCFFITYPCRPIRMVVRRGKRNIIGMADEDDFDIFGDPNIEDDEDDDDRTKYTTRRSRMTLPRSGRPFKRSSHDVGLNYATATKKGKKITKS